MLLRLLLVGYLYGITSERRLMDEVSMHLGYRWFTRLGFPLALKSTLSFSVRNSGLRPQNISAKRRNESCRERHR